MPITRYTTTAGIQVSRSIEAVCYDTFVDQLARQLDSQLGCLLSSSYEYPNRYKRWDMGFVNPMLRITSRADCVWIEALNARGHVMLPFLAEQVKSAPFVAAHSLTTSRFDLTIKPSTEAFTEEDRSRQPSVFSVLRLLRDLLFSSEDAHLGLYGALGYDLAFQFEKIDFVLPRADDQRDMVLFLPDSIFIRDHERQEAFVYHYEFSLNGQITEGLARTGEHTPYVPAQQAPRDCDHLPGEYAALVNTAKEYFARGDLFEVVPGQTFYLPCTDAPSAVFIRLKHTNPSPYGFIMNLGQSEYLVGASPEMFVRVTDRLVETCPISGTIPRGTDAISDADQIRTLLNSDKDHNELTMCTDVDRNDKSRICVPGSIEVIGRRQIELYSRLIHTVDHVRGTLREGYDALDAFLSHTWAVTVTGAPKFGAMCFLESHEHSARRWYGGAVGKIGFNGDINTGLTLRTIRIANGIAEVRAGATLLSDSIPEAEEEETRVKASAQLRALKGHSQTSAQESASLLQQGLGKSVLLIDHQDSFVHTLADYFRQTGAAVTTLRYGFDEARLDTLKPDLVVLSPGPGRPQDFALSRTIGQLIQRNIPIFGVCLGLQGLVEYFGGQLGVLDIPQHGRPSNIHVLTPNQGIFKGLEFNQIQVGRYHSLYALEEVLPAELAVTAITDDHIIMAIQHKTLPIAAVQFHPESIMTFKNKVGITLVNNAYGLIGCNDSA
ncbi:MAG: anthranilate synthase TrpE [Pseudomonadota bacterium]|jgi:anthranilate synthase